MLETLHDVTRKQKKKFSQRLKDLVMACDHTQSLKKAGKLGSTQPQSHPIFQDVDYDRPSLILSPHHFNPSMKPAMIYSTYCMMLRGLYRVSLEAANMATTLDTVYTR